MITIRPSEERGHNNHGWLDTHFTFSFADYFDPKHMGFRDLRVINEDWISAGKGFGMHPHRDMEIITYIIEGELNHRDSTGRGAAIKQNDVQRMSAGTGVMHSEVNQSTKPVHLLQIWILPEAEGLKPSYEDRTFPVEEKRNQLRLIASHDGREGSTTINQDTSVYASLLEGGKKVGARTRARPSCLGAVGQRGTRRKRRQADQRRWRRDQRRNQAATDQRRQQRRSGIPAVRSGVIPERRRDAATLSHGAARSYYLPVAERTPQSNHNKSGALAWLSDTFRSRGLFGAVRWYAAGAVELLRDLTPARRKSRYGDIDYDFEHGVDTTWANVTPAHSSSRAAFRRPVSTVGTRAVSRDSQFPARRRRWLHIHRSRAPARDERC